jgi:hypothetical protein
LCSPYDGLEVERVVTSGVTLYQGALIAINTSNEINKPLAVNTTMVVGRLKHPPKMGYVIGDGTVKAKVEQGIFLLDNSATDTVTAAYIGKSVFVEDDHTVAIVGTLRAGTCFDVTSEGVWVIVGFGASGAGTLALNASAVTGSLI